MKRIISGKQLVPAALVLVLAVGCSSKPSATENDAMSEANQAVEAAKASVAEAKSLDWIWRDTEDMLAEAEAELAAGAGHEDAAIKLANKAGSQADLAVNQYYLEEAKVMYAAASSVSGLSAAQKNALAEADKAIRNAEGRKAYDLLAPLMTELQTASL